MKGKVWIVDDDEDILEVLRIVIKKEGYDPMTIQNPKDIILLLEKQIPDLILMDILMSGYDGREISKEIKNNEKTRNIPIVMMSADLRIEKKVEEANADGYIKKPFDLENLLEVINGKVYKKEIF